MCVATSESGTRASNDDGLSELSAIADCHFCVAISLAICDLRVAMSAGIAASLESTRASASEKFACTVR